MQPAVKACAMSVLTEYVDKRYTDSLPNQRVFFNTGWTAASGGDDRGFFEGYAHSLYFPLEGDYDRLYNRLYAATNALRVFTAYTEAERVKFCRFDGHVPARVAQAATVYETMTIDETQVYTMENANLIYSIDKVARVRERPGEMSAAEFVGGDGGGDTFAANGHWCHRDGGVLYLGRQYTRPEFRFPASKYVRYKFNAPATIGRWRRTSGGDEAVRGGDETLEELARRDVTPFLMLVVYSTGAFHWNHDSLVDFVRHMELDMRPDEMCELHALMRSSAQTLQRV